MQSPFAIKLLRWAAYGALLLVLPLLGWVGWWMVQFMSGTADPTVYVLISHTVVAILVVGILVSGVTAYIPTKKDEEIAQLVRMQEEYLTLYEHSPVPYLTLDRLGHIKMLNLAAVRLLGSTTDAMFGCAAVDIFVDTPAADPAAVRSAIVEHRPVPEAELQIKTASGQVRWVKLSFLVFGNGRENLLAMIDITRAKEIDAAKSEFVALATHQLRTPLAAIRWNTELLELQLGSVMTAPMQEYLTKVQRNTIRMSDLINDFLSASQLEMGTFSTNAQAIPLAEFFRTVLEEFTGRVKSQNLTIQQSFTPEDAVLFVDPRLLHIIVSNLVSNAVKYTPPNGTVAVSYQVTHGTVVITVSDTGIGIPEHEQEQLFSKFFRATNAREMQAEGTGLGLYVVQQSVQKLHGSMAMRSSANQGTTFQVTLPHRQS